MSMTAKTKARIICIVGIPTTVCLIAWCGGYNFDTRNADVGFATAMTLFATVWAIFAPWDELL